MFYTQILLHQDLCQSNTFPSIHLNQKCVCDIDLKCFQIGMGIEWDTLECLMVSHVEGHCSNTTFLSDFITCSMLGD